MVQGLALVRAGGERKSAGKKKKKEDGSNTRERKRSLAFRSPPPSLGSMTRARMTWSVPPCSFRKVQQRTLVTSLYS